MNQDKVYDHVDDGLVNLSRDEEKGEWISHDIGEYYPPQPTSKKDDTMVRAIMKSYHTMRFSTRALSMKEKEMAASGMGRTVTLEYKLQHIPKAIVALLLLIVTYIYGLFFWGNLIDQFGGSNTDLFHGDPQAANLHFWLILLNQIAVAVAIFHAGSFPVYSDTEHVRSKDPLADAFGVMAWSVLGIHSGLLFNRAVLLVTRSPMYTILLFPASTLLPAAQFVLSYHIPDPAIHFIIGTLIDYVCHVSLVVLYFVQAGVTGDNWLLLGGFGELAHLASVVPETVAHYQGKGRVKRTFLWLVVVNYISFFLLAGVSLVH